jgi:hypothetical protein
LYLNQDNWSKFPGITLPDFLQGAFLNNKVFPGVYCKSIGHSLRDGGLFLAKMVYAFRILFNTRGNQENHVK